MTTTNFVQNQPSPIYERNILGPGEHCPECVALTALGWRPQGSMPRPGRRLCKKNCKCKIELRKTSDIYDFVKMVVSGQNSPTTQTPPAPGPQVVVPPAGSSGWVSQEMQRVAPVAPVQRPGGGITNSLGPLARQTWLGRFVTSVAARAATAVGSIISRVFGR